MFLLSIGRSTITHDIFAPAVGTKNGDRDHQTFYLFHDFCSYSTAPFPSLPLPESDHFKLLPIIITTAERDRHLALLDLALLVSAFLEEEQHRLQQQWHRPVTLGEARREIQRRHRRLLLLWLFEQFQSGVHPDSLVDLLAA